MLIIDSASALAAALARPLDQPLARLLALRGSQLGVNIEDAARFIIVEPPDTLAAIEQAVGFPFSWTNADHPGPTWEWAERHDGGWTEIVFVLSDDGAAEVLLVPDRDDLDPALSDIIREHVAPADDRLHAQTP
ncbi:hypothetical protein [Sphingomonas sp.]|uniref:hypothetical protein n=1 Tax=Sphingomonas sp. TaxID=28214 RepID=UPI003CC6615A